MKLCPGLDEPPLCPWQIASDQLNGVEAENTNGLLVVRVEVRRVMRRGQPPRTCE